MPFSRPSLTRLISRAQGDTEALLMNGGAQVRQSVESTLARVMAGLSHGQHGHLQYISEQIVPDRAEDAFLVRHAEFWGVQRLPATVATIQILATGVGGSSLPAGSEWSRADGTRYVVDSTVAIPAVPPDEVVANLTATSTLSDPLNGTGADGNTEGGTVLSLTSPVAGIDTDATVQGTVGELQGNGADLETIESLRNRLLDRVQTPPSGGGPGDYVDTARTVSGVTRAWELPLQLGPATILVLFVQDVIDSDGTFIDTIFPSPAAIADVQTALDAFAPVIALPTAAAPTEIFLNPSIQLAPNDAATQAQVVANLHDLLLRRAAPDSTLFLSEINEAISLAPNETNHVIVSPVADVVSGDVELLTLGTPVFADVP